MKKFLALVLSVLLIASLSVTAFAAVDSTSGSGTDTGTVYVDVVDKDGNPLDDEDIKKIYSVEVAWGDLTFTFQSSVATNDLIWDDAAHKYTNLAGSWTNNDKEVTVTNHSNAGISVGALFSNDAKTSAEKMGVTATLSNGDANLGSAAGTTTANAPKATYTVSVSGTPYTLDKFDVDVITATISPWNGN